MGLKNMKWFVLDDSFGEGSYFFFFFNIHTMLSKKCRNKCLKFFLEIKGKKWDNFITSNQEFHKIYNTELES